MCEEENEQEDFLSGPRTITEATMGEALATHDATESFYIVCNFKSRHWLMKDTKYFKTIPEAAEYAKYLSYKYSGNSYYIMKALSVVRKTPPPIEIVELK